MRQDFTNTEVSDALKSVGTYSTPTPRTGRPATEEYWDEAKQTIQALLQQDPDTLLHLIREATEYLDESISKSRSAIDSLKTLSAFLSVDPVAYESDDIQSVRNNLQAFSRVAGSRPGRSRRMTGLERSVRKAVAKHEGSSFVGGGAIKNRKESLEDSRTLLDTLDDLHPQVLLAVAGILSAKDDYEDEELQADSLRRVIDAADAGLESLQGKLQAGGDVADTSERNTTLQMGAVLASVRARTDLEDPEDYKASGAVQPVAPCEPAEVTASNQPPYIIGENWGRQVDMDVDGTAYSWFMSPSKGAELRTRKISSDNPLVVISDADAQLKSKTFSTGNAVIDMERVNIGGAVTATVTAINSPATGQPARLQASVAIFTAGAVYPGDILVLDGNSIAGGRGWEIWRILQFSSTTEAIVEIPLTLPGVGPYAAIPVGTRIVVDDRMKAFTDSNDVTALTLASATVINVGTNAAAAARYVNISTVEADYNASYPGAETPFSIDPPSPNHTNLLMTSSKSGSGGKAAVIEAYLLAEREETSAMQLRLSLRDRRTDAYWQAVVTDVSGGNFQPEEVVTFSVGAVTATVVSFMPPTGVLVVKDASAAPPASGGTVTGATSGASGNLDNADLIPIMFGQDGNGYLHLYVDDAGQPDGHSLDGTVSDGEYTDPAFLAAEIQTQIDNPETWVNANAQETGEITIRTKSLGSVSWIELQDDTTLTGADLQTEVKKGADTTVDHLLQDLKRDEVPVDPVTDEETVIDEITVASFGTGGVAKFFPFDGDFTGAAVGDRLVVEGPINALLISTVTGTFQVGETVTITAPAGAAASGRITKIVTISGAPFDTLALLEDVEGEWVVGASLQSSGGATGTLPSSLSVPGDDTGVGNYRIDALPTVTEAQTNHSPRLGLYKAKVVRTSFGMKSQGTSLDSAVQVSSGVAQAIMGLPTTEVRGTTQRISVDGADLSTIVRSVVRKEDIIQGLSVGDVSITAVMTDTDQLDIDTAIPNDESAVAVIMPRGAVNLSAYRLYLSRWWATFSKTRFVSNLTAIRQYLERSYTAPRWISKYSDLLDQYDAQLSGLQALLTYEANKVEAMTSVLEGLAQQRLNAARDLLRACQLSEFFNLDVDDASDLGRVLKAFGALQRFFPVPAEAEDMAGFLDEDLSVGFYELQEDYDDPEEDNVDLIETDEDEGEYEFYG